MAVITPTKIGCAECTHLKSSLFSALHTCHQEDLTSAKSCTNYKKGQVLYHEGTRPLGVFCINQGKVKVYKTGSNGKEQIITVAKEGDMLGFKALLGDQNYPVTAETLENSAVCFVPKSDFLRLLGESPALNQELLKKVCHEVGSMSEQLTHLAQKSVRERLAVVLLTLREIYSKEDQPGPVEINLSREDLANMVGTATETLIRLLQELKQEQLISSQGRTIRVEDPAGLRRVGQV